MTKPTSKVIQITAISEGPSTNPAFLALCEDGSIWNMVVATNNIECVWTRVLRPHEEEKKKTEIS